MKSFMKIALVTLPLLMAVPSFAQVSWGVDLRFGTPPPRREVIVERPYPEAVWYPGYYSHAGYGYQWMPGRWDRPERFREGWGSQRFEGRDGYRDHRDNGWNGDRGRGQQDYHRTEGRIR